MDWRTLFLSADGRIGQKDFWIGALILFVIWVLTPVLHIFAPLAWMILLYPWVCVFSKRLHDFGKSGFLILLPFVVGACAAVLAFIFGGVTVLSGIVTAMQGGVNPGSWAVFAGALGSMLVFIGIAGLFKFLFILWVGLSAGDPGPNRYGEPPGSLTSGATPPATA
jgi:uncharacterized membrane protein YhaH (DUF805 family)